MSTMTSERCPCCGAPCTKGRKEYPDVDGGESDFVDTYRYAHLDQPAQAVDVVAMMEHLPDNRAATRAELIRAMALTRAGQGGQP